MGDISRKIPLVFFVFSLLFAGCKTISPAAEPSLYDATQKGDIKEMEMLIADGKDVNARDSVGWNPLIYAAVYGNTKAVKLLIAKGAHVNVKTNDGGTPLYWAANSGNKEIVEILISKGADVNVKDNSGKTPLHAAALANYKEVVELLISKGSDLNAKASDGFTPLHSAASGGAKEVVEFLISKGADVNAKDYKGNTPFDVAKENSAVKLLLIPAEADFEEAARNYRAATVKPTLPEEARRFKVQAESAFSKKDYKNAVARYKAALNIAPWWPEGHYNRALIFAELSHYSDAIGEMKKYLVLVPDAPNARAAQDSIYRWEGELK